MKNLAGPSTVLSMPLTSAEMLMNAGLHNESLEIAKALTPSFEKLDAKAQALSLWLDLLALIIQGSRVGLLATSI